MDRAEVALERLRRSEQASKVKKSSNPKGNATENATKAAAPNTSSAAEMPSTPMHEIAYSRGDPGRPIIVPHPSTPVNINDIDAFLHHLSVEKGETPGDRLTSEQAVIDGLTKWNSVYTIIQDPRPVIAHETGHKIGRNLAIRCIVQKKVQLLWMLYEKFNELELKAAENIRDMDSKEIDEYAIYGPTSWYFMSMSQHLFARSAKTAITTIAKSFTPRYEDYLRRVGIKKQMYKKAATAIKNNNGVVFGAGGPSYIDPAFGDFMSKLPDEVKQDFMFELAEARGGQVHGVAGSLGVGNPFQGSNPTGTMNRMGYKFDFEAATAPGGVVFGERVVVGDGAAVGGGAVFGGGTGGEGNTYAGATFVADAPGGEVSGDGRNAHSDNLKGMEETKKECFNNGTTKAPDGEVDADHGEGGGVRNYDFMAKVQLQDEFSSERAEGPPEGIGGDFYDNVEMS
ncbi:hypothetical protein L207DRAFT_567692 [Hyaloscypha variabilis F]|uniref:Uncharacterized protein n=1 Tax=Hyaloscypha variabilis (strain UAMH 11265 / GT02V1 / F) TaxID=1149755 RepID=A0A2J6RHD9_HYAVF|nr:hypothetical protein L207DRAFT_567692 [Hyaloscypha variabilis F]